ncbi:MAG: rhodanese-like domain-containing protein [Phycisphaerales bacterium]
MGPCGCCQRGCGVALKALAIMLASGLIGLVHSRLSPLPLDVPRPESIDAVLARLDDKAVNKGAASAAQPAAADKDKDKAPIDRSAPADPPAAQPAPAAPAPAPAPSGTGQAAPADTLMLSLEQAKTLHARVASAGDVAFVDARNPEEFATGRIPAATNLPPSAFLGGAIPADLDMIPRSLIVVVYCGGGECDASKLTATRLRELGYEKVYVFEQGMTGWKAANLPIEM